MKKWDEIDSVNTALAISILPLRKRLPFKWFSLLSLCSQCLFIIVSCFFTVQVAASGNVLDIDQSPIGQRLSHQLLYWADYKGVTAEAALAEGEFVPLRHQKIVFGAKKHWYLLALQNSSNTIQERALATGLPFTPKLSAYYLDNNHSTLFYQSSASNDYQQRSLPYPLLFVPLVLPAGKTKTILLEHESLAHYPMALRLFHHDSLNQKMADFTLARGILFGALLAFLILFIVQAIAMPTPPLVYYCCYIVCLIFLAGQIFGYNFAYLWPTKGTWNQDFTSFIIGITYSFYFLFSATLFNLKKHFVRLYQFAVALAVLAMCLAVLSIVFNVFIVMTAAALIGLPIPVAIGWLMHKKGSSAAKLFFWGALFHCSLSYLLALECLGFHLGYDNYLFSSLGVVQLIDLVLFSIALLRQTGQLRRALNEQLSLRLHDAEALAAAEQARASALEAQQQNALALASTTHDMTQPLAAMHFALALVDDEKNAEAKKHILETLNYTQTLLKNLTQDGELQYQHSSKEVSAAEFLEKIAQRHRAIIVKKGLRFHVRSQMASFVCMPFLLQRIIDNLLANALRYTASGGIAMTLRNRSGNVLIQIWDTGQGMTEEQLGRLIEPFKQGDINEQQGFGLGLFIVKTLAEQAGYALTMRSVEGKGTCISLYVPQT